MTKATIKPQFLLKKTYLAVIRGSVGSKMFRESHFKIGARDIDVLEHGNLACAFFVSSILKMFDLIQELHTTVNSTEKDMLDSGWKVIDRPRVGCVIIYMPRISAGGLPHRHLAFYIGKGKIIHNVFSKGMPGIGQWNYRSIERLLWHAKLDG